MLTQEQVFQAVAAIYDQNNPSGRYIDGRDWARIDAQIIFEEGGEDEGYTITSEDVASFQASGWKATQHGSATKLTKGGHTLWLATLADGRHLAFHP